jgi:hypothetical protein
MTHPTSFDFNRVEIIRHALNSRHQLISSASQTFNFLWIVLNLFTPNPIDVIPGQLAIIHLN